MEQQKQIGNKFGNNMTNLQRVITHCLNCHLVALLPQLQTVVLTVHVRPIKYSKLHIYISSKSLKKAFSNGIRIYLSKCSAQASNFAFFLCCAALRLTTLLVHTHFASHFVSPRAQTL